MKKMLFFGRKIKNKKKENFYCREKVAERRRPLFGFLPFGILPLLFSLSLSLPPSLSNLLRFPSLSSWASISPSSLRPSAAAMELPKSSW